MGTEIVNWYLVEEDGRLTAVDAGLPGYADTLEADLAAQGRKLAHIEAVVLTHSDGDHFGLAARMREAGARGLVHPAHQAQPRQPGAQSGGGAPPQPRPP